MNTEKTKPVAGVNSSPEADRSPEIPVMVTGTDKHRRALRVGIFVALGIIILIVGIFVIGGKKNLFTKTISVHTRFTTVEGLRSGAGIVMNGIKVGTVRSVELLMDTSSYVRVDMVIDGDYHKFVRRSTKATVAQQGIIGEKLIELIPGNAAAPVIKDGDAIASVPPANYLAILDEARAAVKNTENITASLDTLFLRFRRGEGTLGKFLTDDEAYTSLVAVSNSAQQLFDESSKSLANMSATLDRAVTNVDAITEQSKILVADIAKGKGTIGGLLYDRSLYDSLESLTATLNEAASSAGFAAREFGINMRGLRANWLVGGLFSGGEEQIKDLETQTKMIQIRLDEIQRQKELLDKREQQMILKEANIQR